MRTPAQADLQRWSDEVARDPRSLAFLPLARAYRRQGLHDTALQLCLRGLEAYPSHVEAHGLLALLYVERGEHEKAADEWSIVLRIDPDNFEALRGLGFCYMQQDRLSRARQMLERAALLRPADPAVHEALRMLGVHMDAQEQAPQPAPSQVEQEPAAAEQAPAAAAEQEQEQDQAGSRPVRWHDDTPFELVEPEAEPVEQAAEAVTPAAAEATTQPEEHASSIDVADERDPVATRHDAAAPSRVAGAQQPARAAAAGFGYSTMADPASLFEDLVGSGPVLGALVVDTQGLVLAGRMTDPERDAAVLGAVLGGAAFEAGRTAAHLSLGEWRGIMMEAGDAVLHLVPAGPTAMVVLAARKGTAAGWMRRAAAQAADRAQLYMEAYG